MNRFPLVVLLSLLAAACGVLRPGVGLQEAGVVQGPVYGANKVLFLQESDPPDRAVNPQQPANDRIGQLKAGYELAGNARRGEPSGTRRAVRNRQPLSIVISRAYLPADIITCNRRTSDALFGRTRDIAVLLDVSAAVDSQEFIAVWYQQNVSPDDLLVFQDLLVYSSDAWDAKYPPYFRLRLVDVSAERNTAVGALLDRVRSSSKSITGLLGVPGADPIVGVAALAARQVLANERNRALVDFTFQLYGEHLLAESGGVPLGVLQTGGMLVLAPPCRAGNAFWEHQLRYDHRLDRVVDSSGAVMSMPFVFATILTADLSVPQIVRTRSAAILRRLTDPQVVQAELHEAQRDADQLATALQALAVWEEFRRQPSKANFGRLVDGVAAAWTTTWTSPENQNFFLNRFYNVTGAGFATAEEYRAWFANCSAAAQFNSEAGRYNRDDAVRGQDGNPCWS